MGIWHLSLLVSDQKCATTVKSYIRERNEEYGFCPYDESTLIGLEYTDDGVVYRDGTPAELVRFFEFSEEVAAHFPQMNLLFCEFNCDTQRNNKYRSKYGKLQLIKERIIEFYTEGDFECMRSALISLVKEVGLELEQQEDLMGPGIFAITYDELTEQAKLDHILDSISSLLPETEIVCIKVTDECCEAPYESFCIIKGGKYAWNNLDYDMNQIMVEIYDPLAEKNECDGYKRFHVVKNPAAAAEKMLANSN